MQKHLKIDKNIKLKNPIVICAWPGMGQVAYRAASFLVEKLKMEEFAHLDAKEFFWQQGVVIEENIVKLPEEPFNKFYFLKNSATKIGGSAKNLSGKFDKNDLIVFLSNAQPDLLKAQKYINNILSLIKRFDPKMVITFAAMPQAIDHLKDPQVWAASTDKKLIEDLKKHNLEIMRQGQISGMNGLFLGLAKEAGIKGFCLLGEIPLYTIQIDNPKASKALIEALSKILEIKIDVQELIDQSHLIEGEIDKIVDYLKTSINMSQFGPIGEEEINQIKHVLNQQTKLPGSIKVNIEKLFIDAKKDISKASDLKKELDKWSVYKEYEDRFLDLFKKSKETSN
ncbi:MAG: PAC2 family protein [Candidatus Omnitrophota bacterium]